ALTEPAHGSDVVALETRARRDGHEWVLTGEKPGVGHWTRAGMPVGLARAHGPGGRHVHRRGPRRGRPGRRVRRGTPRRRRTPGTRLPGQEDHRQGSEPRRLAGPDPA